MRLLVRDVELLDDIAVVYGVDLDGEHRSAVIDLNKAPIVAGALRVSRLAACDVDPHQIITPDPFF